MSPRDIDWRSVQVKLRRMQELLDQLHRLQPLPVTRLAAEPVTNLAVERIVTLVVDLAVAANGHVAVSTLGRAPDSYAGSFDLAATAGMITPELAGLLRPSVGLRNVLVHDYLETDSHIVADAVSLAVEQYGYHVQQVAAFLASLPDGPERPDTSAGAG